MSERIIIGADMVPTKSNYRMFLEGDLQKLFGEDLLQYFNKASYRIVNLECPFIKKENPISKCGPVLGAPVETIKIYNDLHINLLCLGNNHIMDHSVTGLTSTLDIIDKYGMNYVGAGMDLLQAEKPFIFKLGKKRIGIYSCCEREFSVADERMPGTNPVEPLLLSEHIQAMKEKCDSIIVLYHGGKELYRYPTPNLQKTCRKIVDYGADIVICQHSHCIGCEEKWGSGVIIYGQGNFLFDRYDIEEWQTGLLVEIDEELSINYVPLKKQHETVRLAKNEEAKYILSQFYKRSEEIQKNGIIELKYDELVEANLKRYLFALNGNRSFLFKVIDKITNQRYSDWVFKRKYQKDALLQLLNYIECETHRELFIDSLKRLVYSNSRSNDN